MEGWVLNPDDGGILSNVVKLFKGWVTSMFSPITDFNDYQDVSGPEVVDEIICSE